MIKRKIQSIAFIALITGLFTHEANADGCNTAVCGPHQTCEEVYLNVLHGFIEACVTSCNTNEDCKDMSCSQGQAYCTAGKMQSAQPYCFCSIHHYH